MSRDCWSPRLRGQILESGPSCLYGPAPMILPAAESGGRRGGDRNRQQGASRPGGETGRRLQGVAIAHSDIRTHNDGGHSRLSRGVRRASDGAGMDSGSCGYPTEECMGPCMLDGGSDLQGQGKELSGTIFAPPAGPLPEHATTHATLYTATRYVFEARHTADRSSLC